MAVVQNPITGRSKGAVAGVVFSKWKDKNTLRGKPLTVSNPKTTAQTNQRTKFSVVVTLARFILAILRYSLKYAAVSLSEFNYFIQKNVSLADPATGKIAAGSESLMVFAAGVLFGFYNTLATAIAGLDITITWDATFMADEREATDEVLFFTYNTTTGEVKFFDDGDLYSAGTATIENVGVAGDDVYCFICVQKADKSQYSPSEYVGHVTILA